MSYERLYVPNSDGIFESPLGEFDTSLYTDRWVTVADYLEEVFTLMYPHSRVIEALTDRNISYSHLFAVGQRVKSQLIDAGLERSDQKNETRESKANEKNETNKMNAMNGGVCTREKTVILMVGENSLEWLAVFIACHLMRGEVVFSATHPSSPWPEISRSITTTCATVLVLTRNCYQKIAEEIDHPFLTHVIITDSRGGEGLGKGEGEDEGGESYEVTLTSTRREQIENPEYDRHELDDVCQMLLSSGTSGSPKPIKISPQMIFYNILALASKGTYVYSPADISLLAQPLSHVGGQNIAFLSVIYHGPSLVVTDYPGSVGVLEMVQKYKMTHIIAVPVVLNFLSQYEQLDQFDLSSLKYILAGATIPNFEKVNLLLRRAKLEGKCRLKNIYGASELCGVVFATNDRLLTPIESVGVCAPGISFKIARMGEEERDRITSTAPASGLITEPGVEGQMMIRLPNGQQLDKLYFNDPQKTKDSMTEDGFYKTGDIAKLDENCNVYITGRMSESIKFRGFYVSADEIEEIVMQSDLVMDCAVVGEPSVSNVESPVAFVVPSPKGTLMPQEKIKETLIAHVAASVSAYKQIREVYFIDQIPRNGNGKTMRKELKKGLIK